MYEYILAAVCALAGFVVMIRMHRENKIFLPLGIFLILMGGWIFANKMLDGLLSTGWYVWVSRAVLLVVIILLIKVLINENKKKNIENKEKNELDKK